MRADYAIHGVSSASTRVIIGGQIRQRNRDMPQLRAEGNEVERPHMLDYSMIFVELFI